MLVTVPQLRPVICCNSVRETDARSLIVRRTCNTLVAGILDPCLSRAPPRASCSIGFAATTLNTEPTRFLRG